MGKNNSKIAPKNRKEKMEIGIIILKPILLTVLPLLFKKAYDIWQDSESLDGKKDGKFLFIFIIILTVHLCISVYFAISENKMREKKHKEEIKGYKNEIKEQKDINKKNILLLADYSNKIDNFHKDVSKQSKIIEDQKNEILSYKEKITKMSNELKAYHTESKDTAFLLIDQIITGTANDIYREIKRIRNNVHSEVLDWKLVESNCDKICQMVYDYVRSIAQRGDGFSVSVVFKAAENNIEGYYMPSRISSDKNKPSIYRNFEPKEKYVKYCFNDLLQNTSTKHKICKDKEEIKASFEKPDADYSQYIGIPIYCTGSKKIALMQIIAYNESVIFEDIALLEYITTNLFIPIANLVLLVDKTENILQIINNIDPIKVVDKDNKVKSGFFRKGKK